MYDSSYCTCIHAACMQNAFEIIFLTVNVAYGVSQKLPSKNICFDFITAPLLPLAHLFLLFFCICFSFNRSHPTSYISSVPWLFFTPFLIIFSKFSRAYEHRGIALSKRLGGVDISSSKILKMNFKYIRRQLIINHFASFNALHVESCKLPILSDNWTTSVFWNFLWFFYWMASIVRVISLHCTLSLTWYWKHDEVFNPSQLRRNKARTRFLFFDRRTKPVSSQQQIIENSRGVFIDLRVYLDYLVVPLLRVNEIRRQSVGIQLVTAESSRSSQMKFLQPPATSLLLNMNMNGIWLFLKIISSFRSAFFFTVNSSRFLGFSRAVEMEIFPDSSGQISAVPSWSQGVV